MRVMFISYFCLYPFCSCFPKNTIFFLMSSGFRNFSLSYLRSLCSLHKPDYATFTQTKARLCYFFMLLKKTAHSCRNNWEHDGHKPINSFALSFVFHTTAYMASSQGENGAVKLLDNVSFLPETKCGSWARSPGYRPAALRGAPWESLSIVDGCVGVRWKARGKFEEKNGGCF